MSGLAWQKSMCEMHALRGAHHNLWYLALHACHGKTTRRREALCQSFLHEEHAVTLIRQHPHAACERLDEAWHPAKPLRKVQLYLLIPSKFPV